MTGLAEGGGLAGAALPGFLLGYLLILAVPGPNTLAVAGLAALRGLGAALPLCLGLTLGAWALAGMVLLAAKGVVADASPAMGEAGRILGAAMLLFVAARVLRDVAPATPGRKEQDRVPGSGGEERHGCPTAPLPPGRAGRRLALTGRAGGALGTFLVGFLTAGTNPITGAFFAVQFLGPSGRSLAGTPTALALAAATPLLFYLAVAGLLSHRATMAAVLACGRPIRVLAAASMVVQAGAMLVPLLRSGLG
jgi:threonine/homoserine/homoserine lactone efflux protein